jgi:transcriptional regulator
MPRANPLWQALAAGPLQVLVTFQGPQAYISPNWYPSKPETHQPVPTWNYSTVHVHGELSAHPESEWTRQVLTDMTSHFEAGEPEPWGLADAAPGWVDQLLRILVGLELRVTRLDGKFKLSQNKALRDVQGVIDALRINNHFELARDMADVLSLRL